MAMGDNDDEDDNRVGLVLQLLPVFLGCAPTGTFVALVSTMGHTGHNDNNDNRAPLTLTGSSKSSCVHLHATSTTDMALLAVTLTSATKTRR
jgi:hypothetical protein